MKNKILQCPSQENQIFQELKQDYSLGEARKILGVNGTEDYQQIRMIYQEKLGRIKQSQQKMIELSRCYQLVLSQKSQRVDQIVPATDKKQSYFSGFNFSFKLYNPFKTSQKKKLQESLQIFQLNERDLNSRNVEWAYKSKKGYYSKFLEDPWYKKKLQKLEESYIVLKQKIKPKDK